MRTVSMKRRRLHNRLTLGELLHARELTFRSTKLAHALISVLEPCASNGAPGHEF